MKIAQVCSGYHSYIGGIETYVSEITERLAKKGYDIEVLTTDPSGMLSKEEVINDVSIRRFKSWAPHEAYYFSRGLKKYLTKNSNNYDLVHAHNYGVLPALYAMQTKGDNKLVFSPFFHGKGHTFFRNLLHMPYKYVGRKIFEKADSIVCVSNHEKNLVIKNFNIDQAKIVTIPIGLNLKEFKGLKRKEGDNKVILYVGRLEEYKGVHYLINVLPELSEDIILEIVGKGPYKTNLLSLIKQLNLGTRVRFYQDLPRNELLQKYANANLFVMLSKHESYGISVAEALTSRTPCIVADTSALREWINGENCFGIKYPLNNRELVDLINNTIGKTVSKINIYDWNDTTEELMKIYNSLIINESSHVD